MNVLTDEDLNFFRENGHVVVPTAAPPQNVDATIAAIFDFLDMDANNPETWYQPPLRADSMVQMYQHQALWDNRQSPRIHAAFADLFETEKLWVSMDRASLKPPPHP